ncbi:MAG: AAA family ATPase [Rhodocyclaceae bacterium]|nr:AAA family ATPase [Rhodocyclaceae bacterium]MBP6279439.1 AAA family ATPase [Rhodocyclaceae bacterium]
MYLEHFGLNEAPFRITPHTDFFFAGANRGPTLDALVYAITHDEGIVKVSGEVGSGKTMLCRVLMERLPEKVTTIYLANPSLSRDDILYAIADELTIAVPENSRTATVLRSLHTHLIQSFSEGKQVVVLIDEAHAMPTETLEEIRLLSNLESNKHKLLQLVLFGQPELNDVLGRSDMRQLKERITHNFVLEPLIHEDVAGYLDFRMRAAGYKGPNLFVSDAIKAISKASLGLTRRINIIADKALLAAYSNGGHQVGLGEVTAAIKDCDFSTTSFTKPRANLPLILAAAVGIALIVGIWLGGYLSTPAIVAEPVPAPISLPKAAPVVAPSISQADTAIAPSPALGAAPVQAPVIVAAAPPKIAPPLSPTAEVPLTPVQKKENSSAPAVSLPPPAATTDSPTKITALTLAALTQAGVDEGRTWLKSADDKHWFIQLLATDETRADAVEMYLRRAQKAKELDGVRVYISDVPGTTRIGVIFGDFESRDAAYAALRDLPKTLRTGKPYPRQVIRLR